MSRATSDKALLKVAWPIDLGLTVASHGWVHLEPWRWDAKTGTLSGAERIGDRARIACQAAARHENLSAGLDDHRNGRMSDEPVQN